MRSRLSGLLSRLMKLIDDYFGEDLSSAMARGVSGTMGLKVGFASLNILVSLVLSRLLGAEGYGVFAWVVAWMTVLAVPAELGLGQLLTRNIAVYQQDSDWRLIRGILRRSRQGVLLASIILTAGAGLTGWHLIPASDHATRVAFLYGLPIVPFAAYLRLQQGALKGLGEVVKGQTPELLVRPVLLLGAVGALALVSGQGPGLSSVSAVGANSVAYLLAFLVGVVVLHASLPSEAKSRSPSFETRTWLASAGPLILVSGMQVVRNKTDILMLGIFSGSEAAGVYSIAGKGASLIALVIAAFHIPLSPIVARLYAREKLVRLEQITSRAALAILGVSLPLAAVLLVFGGPILDLFGPDFRQGWFALVVLSLGQLVNAGVGTVAMILVMTEYERDTAVGMAVGTTANVVLNGALIPFFGINGAAVATALSIAILNLFLLSRIHGRLGIRSSFLGVFKPRRTA